MLLIDQDDNLLNEEDGSLINSVTGLDEMLVSNGKSNNHDSLMDNSSNSKTKILEMLDGPTP